MVKSEYLDGNEVIKYYHLLLSVFDNYQFQDVPKSLFVNKHLPYFDSQDIDLINEKKDYIIGEYKQKYGDKNIFCKEYTFNKKCKYFSICHKNGKGISEVGRLSVMSIELKLMTKES